MKHIKTLLIAVVCTLLVACGGHGYEGEYKFASDSKDDLLGGFTALLAGDSTIVIGADFLEIDGTRDEFDEIFVRDSGSKKYLVFSANGTEEAWQIIDEDTLVQDAGFIKLTIKRID